MSTNTMPTNTQSVILMENRCEGCSVPTVRLYHRNSPETWAQGPTTAEAATQLLNLLTRDLDKVAGWDHRQVLQGIIDDVQDYLESLEPAEDTSPALADR
ncbi:hypothetical protein BH23PLA1_BH23PLA1_07010 [soil metagenome]